MKLNLTLLVTTVALLSAVTTVPAFAQSSVPQLESMLPPMHSRTCGLVLLSDGRAKVRANDQEGAMSELISAFALLQDGRALDDKAAARTASLAFFRSDAATKSAAIANCQQWLGYRRNQPDFDKSEEAQWSWAQQAMLTAQTER